MTKSKFGELSGFHTRELLRDPMSVSMGLFFPLMFMGLFAALPSSQLGGTEVSGVQFGLTGVIMMALLTLGFSATATPITQMRENEVLRSFQLLGVSRAQYISAVLLSRLIVAVVQVVLVLMFGALAARPLNVNWLAMLTATGLAIILTQSLALFVGGLSARTSVVAGVTGALVPVLLMGSGILLPPTILPDLVRDTFSINPLAQIGDLMRHATLGTPLEFPIWRTVATSLGASLLAFVATALTFRWQEEE